MFLWLAKQLEVNKEIKEDEKDERDKKDKQKKKDKKKDKKKNKKESEGDESEDDSSPKSKIVKTDSQPDTKREDESPKEKLCYLHGLKLIYFCETCEEPICDKCILLGPHNNQVILSTVINISHSSTDSCIESMV